MLNLIHRMATVAAAFIIVGVMLVLIGIPILRDYMSAPSVREFVEMYFVVACVAMAGCFAWWFKECVNAEKAVNAHRICVECGYDLRESTGKCPDCGERIRKSRKAKALPFLRHIHLIKQDHLKLKNPRTFETAVGEFRKLGFQDVGGFEIRESKGSRFFSLAIPEHQAWALVTENSMAGVYSEIFVALAGGGGWGACNSEYLSRTSPAPLPQWPTVQNPRLNAEGLLAEWLKVKDQYSAVPVVIADFQAAFAKDYREQREFELIHPITPEEVLRIAAFHGRKIDDRQLAMTIASTEARKKQKLDWLLPEKYRESIEISDEKWKLLLGRLVVVHERMTIDDAMLEFGEWKGRVEKSEGGVLEVFEAANASLLPEKRLEKLGEVRSPVLAAIYAIRESGE